jgi:hypothetical protein
MTMAEWPSSVCYIYPPPSAFIYYGGFFYYYFSSGGWWSQALKTSIWPDLGCFFFFSFTIWHHVWILPKSSQEAPLYISNQTSLFIYLYMASVKKKKIIMIKCRWHHHHVSCFVFIFGGLFFNYGSFCSCPWNFNVFLAGLGQKFPLSKLHTVLPLVLSINTKIH